MARRRKAGIAPVATTGPIGLTPDQEAEDAGTRALIRVFGSIGDCAGVAPLDRTIGIALEALAFAGKKAGDGRTVEVGRGVDEMKGELLGMLWEGR